MHSSVFERVGGRPVHALERVIRIAVAAAQQLGAHALREIQIEPVSRRPVHPQCMVADTGIAAALTDVVPETSAAFFLNSSDAV